MNLIQTETALRKYIPNVIQSVKGETPLIDKLTPYLQMAEQWMINEITGDYNFLCISESVDADMLKQATSKAVVAEALRYAIPSLDIVLTPNGFGIVSNSNIAPASKERVSRLIDMLEAERDNAIRNMLPSLFLDWDWEYTKQHDYFASTLFPNLDICDAIGFPSHQWMKYREVHPLLVEIENFVIRQFIGQEQMDVFRKEAMSPFYTEDTVFKNVFYSLRAYVAQTLKERLASKTTPFVSSPPSTLVDIVNTIKNNPDTFPEWHNTSIAELYKPAVYENKKKDKGYWF